MDNGSIRNMITSNIAGSKPSHHRRLRLRIDLAWEPFTANSSKRQAGIDLAVRRGYSSPIIGTAILRLLDTFAAIHLHDKRGVSCVPSVA